ncbi:MAG: elongation factor Ts, partial [Alphaproteobacteria bacterium]|nr:elongation factor Ts [Alphaproteobacteria bacterium]
MADITAQLVKDLRDKTGAGMMDCKKALAEVAGDLEAAIDWLRKKGLSAAAKKAGRVAAEGLVAIAAEGTRAVALEVNAETDFVGRNEQFQSFVLQAAKLAIAAETLEALQAMPYPGSARNVADELTQLVATIGENMTMRRMAKLSVAQGVVATYVHTAVAPNVGRIAVLVALESAGDAAALLALGKQIAMHIAAAKPDYLNIADVPPEAVEREKNVLTEQALASGKPAQAIEKMVEGRLR